VKGCPMDGGPAARPIEEAAQALAGVPSEEFVRLVTAELIRRQKEFGWALPELRTLLDFSLVTKGRLLVAEAKSYATSSDIDAAERGERPDPKRMVGEWLNTVRITLEARHSVLKKPMLDASAVAVLVGRGSTRRDVASALRRRGALLGVPVGNRFLYPAFQFDVTSRELWPVVADVNVSLHAAEDPWAVASWWVSPHGRLPEGVAPKDLLGQDRDEDLRTLARSVAAA
jgi:hypothetical protein